MPELVLDDRGVIISCNACGTRNRLAFDRLGHTARCGQCKQPLDAPAEPLEVMRTADFDRLVEKSSLPIVVDYWAPWCGPCRIVAPELQKVAAQQRGRAVVVKVNTDQLPDLGDRFGIRSIPTLAVFAGGREVTRAAGARPAAEIQKLIESVSGQRAAGQRA